jgi:hypothetical protein
MSRVLSLMKGQETPKSVFLCFVRCSQHSAVTYMNSNDRIVFVIESVFFCKIINEVVGISGSNG